jgi:chromosomal replication initiator protein
MMSPNTFAGLPYDRQVRYRKDNYTIGVFSKPEPELESILKVVCDYLNVQTDIVKSKTRIFEVKKARFYYFYFARTITEKGFKKIGNVVTRNHATVIHGITTVKDWVVYDKEFKSEIEEIKELLTKTGA